METTNNTTATATATATATVNVNVNEVINKIFAYAEKQDVEKKVFEINEKAPAAKETLTANFAAQLLAANDTLQVWQIGCYYGLLCHKSDVRFDNTKVKRNAEIKLDGKVYNKTRLLDLINEYHPKQTDKGSRGTSYRVQFETAQKEVERLTSENNAQKKEIETLTAKLKAYEEPADIVAVCTLIELYEVMKAEKLEAARAQLAKLQADILAATPASQPAAATASPAQIETAKKAAKAHKAKATK